MAESENSGESVGETTTAGASAPTESLESLASEFQTQESLPPQRSEETSEARPKFETPQDALKWLAQEHSKTRNELTSISSKLREKEQQDWMNEQVAALDDAIKTVGSEVEDLDPMFIEGALHTIYNRDENFKKIFNNRKQNPAAYKKALGLIAEQVRSKLTTKHDPDVAAGKRAMEQLKRSSRSGKSQPENKYANMSAAEFDRAWESLKSGY